MARTTTPINTKQPGKPCLPVKEAKFVRIVRNAQIEDIYNNLTETQQQDLEDLVFANSTLIVENSDQSFQQAPNANPFVLPDIDIIQDGTVQASVPSAQNINLNVVIQ